MCLLFSLDQTHSICLSCIEADSFQIAWNASFEIGDGMRETDMEFRFDAIDSMSNKSTVITKANYNFVNLSSPQKNSPLSEPHCDRRIIAPICNKSEIRNFCRVTCGAYCVAWLKLVLRTGDAGLVVVVEWNAVLKSRTPNTGFVN